MQCCYSPDEKFVLTGTSAETKDSSGKLVVLRADDLQRVGEVEVDGSAVAVHVGSTELWQCERCHRLAIRVCGIGAERAFGSHFHINCSTSL